MLPVGYKGGLMNVPYREIAPPPNDETEALSLIRSVIERHVGRLHKLLAEHEEIEAEEAAERYDRAALDCSPAFERHRRYQSARHRELMRTLETLRKMRKEEFGTGNGKSGVRSSECGMGKEEWRMTNARWQMPNAKWQMTNARCRGASRWQREAPVRSWDTIPIVSLMIRRTTRLESCPTKMRTRQASRDRAMASGSASLTT